MAAMFKTTVQQGEDGEYYLILPDEMMVSLGWKVGDDLAYAIREDGSVLVRKQDPAGSP